jgi:D-cysteine desulfhydrase family pyridoxal phosphate-dependent enzyme
MNRRVVLAQLPTPIEELRALSAGFPGRRLLIKRDDQTGLAFGGNKTRKLEYLLADAIDQKSTVLLTAGAAQSNHCRQTAAAAAIAGVRCVLVLGGAHGAVSNGNLLLDELLGAEIHWTTMERRGERMAEIAEELRRKGERPYLIPIGGSTAVGALGYYYAMQEALQQLATMEVKVDVMIFASSSGGTQAGLVAGGKDFGFGGRIIGISIDKGDRGPERFEDELSVLTNATLGQVGSQRRVTPADFHLAYEYLGGGYGVVGALEREAIRSLAREQGILLDPVYTARAMGGLFDMMRRNVIPPGATVLFWHTGGAPTLFAYASDFQPPPSGH